MFLYFSPTEKVAMVVALIWTLIWKGFALWKAADKKDKWWFVALLVVNTLGVLEIAYIYYFSERRKKPEKTAV